MKVKLHIVQGRPAGKNMLFPRGEYVFGRGPECHVRPNSDCVSRQHCLLRVTEDGAFLRDLGSRNGTLVNGARLVEERQLGHGDQVQVGPLVFEVQLEEPCHDTIPMAAATPGKAAAALVDTDEMKALPDGAGPTREEPTAEGPCTAPITPGSER